MNKPRIVLDTNVVISALLLRTSVPAQVLAASLGKGTILISDETLAELDDVLRRPKFERYISDERRLEFLAAFLRVSGNGTILVTGDRDLLVLHPYRNVNILTPQGFLAARDAVQD